MGSHFRSLETGIMNTSGTQYDLASFGIIAEENDFWEEDQW